MIESEMEDRFGSLPDEVGRLLDIMRLKIMARGMSVTNLSETDGKVRLVFSDETPVLPEKIFGLQKTFGGLRVHRDGFEISLKGGSKDRRNMTVLFDVMKGLT
jgi:transcription-repair coupling factor (superfamily II helicase)